MVLKSVLVSSYIQKFMSRSKVWYKYVMSTKMSNVNTNSILLSQNIFIRFTGIEVIVVFLSNN